MPKLHELLAVEQNLKAQADKTRTDLMATFEKKSHHFGEKIQSFKSYEEGVKPVVEEQLDLQTTVGKELKWISGFISKSIDVSYQVAMANTIARGDVILEDGTTLLSQLPATSLLELEKRAKELHDLISTIPTLDPAKGFHPAPEKGEGVFRARDDIKTRTKKIDRPLSMAPATKEHKEQVQLVSEHVAVGDITVMEWSGLITTASKGDMLSRVEDLTRAIKQARSRANDQEIVEKRHEDWLRNRQVRVRALEIFCMRRAISIRPKTYLGDAVYAEWKDGRLLLTTEDGIQATNTIYLEPEVIDALLKYLGAAVTAPA